MAELAKHLLPHKRVKWVSRYLETKWFRGTIVKRLNSDRFLVRCDPDGKELVISEYRLFPTK